MAGTSGGTARRCRQSSISVNVHRGALGKYSVYFPGHYEVVLVQPLNLLGLQRDNRVAPAKTDTGMMAFGFCEFTNLLDKAECLSEILEPKAPLDPTSVIRQLPFWGLRVEKFRLFAGERRYSTTARSTDFVSESFGHVRTPRYIPNVITSVRRQKQFARLNAVERSQVQLSQPRITRAKNRLSPVVDKSCGGRTTDSGYARSSRKSHHVRSME